MLACGILIHHMLTYIKSWVGNTACLSEFLIISGLYTKLFSSCIWCRQVRCNIPALEDLHWWLQATFKRGIAVDHQILVKIFAFFLGFVKQAFHNLDILLSKTIWLWVIQRAGNMIDTVRLYNTVEGLQSIACTINRDEGLRPSIFRKDLLAMICNM